jgi:hypothetical protein
MDPRPSGRIDKNGRLPPGVTHEILELHPNGLPSVRERRKSLY